MVIIFHFFGLGRDFCFKGIRAPNAKVGEFRGPLREAGIATLHRPISNEFMGDVVH